MDETREEIGNLESELERLSAASRIPGAPPSYKLRIGLIAEGLATKRARLGDLTRRARIIEIDIAERPSGVYPALALPSVGSGMPVQGIIGQESQTASSAPLGEPRPDLPEATAAPLANSSSTPSHSEVTSRPLPVAVLDVPTASSAPEPNEPAPASLESGSEALLAPIRPDPDDVSADATPVPTPRRPDTDAPAVRGVLGWLVVALTLAVLGLAIATLIGDATRAAHAPPPSAPPAAASLPAPTERPSSPDGDQSIGSPLTAGTSRTMLLSSRGRSSWDKSSDSA